MRTLKAKRAPARAKRTRADSTGRFVWLWRAVGFLAARRWGQAVLVALLLLLAGGVGGFTAWRMGYVQMAGAEAQRLLQVGLREAGLTVRSVTAAGRDQTPADVLLQAIGVSVGDSILHADLDAVHARVARLPWVSEVRVSRKLPDTIHLDLVERRPIAIWQTKGRMFLVDYEGEVISEKDVPKFTHLPLVVGDGAAEAVADLLAVLEQEPWLERRVEAAVRVGKRRWNLRLQNGIDVRLPETDPLSAWRMLARFEEEQGLLSRDVEIIDLRIPDQVVVRLGEGRVHRIGASGREARAPVAPSGKGAA